MAHWQFRDAVSPEQRLRFARMFGKLRLRFTQATIIADYEGMRSRSRYEVIGSTSTTVTLRSYEEGKLEVDTIYLGDGFIFKRVGVGINFEYFTRVST